TRRLVQTAGRFSLSRARFRRDALAHAADTDPARFRHAVAGNAGERRSRALPACETAPSRTRARRVARARAGSARVEDAARVVARVAGCAGRLHRARRAGAGVPQSPRLRAGASVPRLRLVRSMHSLRTPADRASRSRATG